MSSVELTVLGNNRLHLFLSFLYILEYKSALPLNGHASIVTHFITLYKGYISGQTCDIVSRS
jgi:hypothetical protein